MAVFVALTGISLFVLVVVGWLTLDRIDELETRVDQLDADRGK
jgi:hypothetical protein